MFCVSARLFTTLSIICDGKDCRTISWDEVAIIQANKRSKRPRGLLKTRLSVTRNPPKEKLRVGVVTGSLKHAHLPENIVCLSLVTMHHGFYEALFLGVGSLWIFVCQQLE